MESVKMEIKFLVAGSLPSNEVLVNEFKERFEKSCTSNSRLAIISEINCQNSIERLQDSQTDIKKLQDEVTRLRNIISKIKSCVNDENL